MLGEITMKTNTTPRRSSLLALVAAVFIGFAAQSQATIINITIDPITGLPANDIDFGILGNNNPTSNFNALVTDIGLYNSFSELTVRLRFLQASEISTRVRST